MMKYYAPRMIKRDVLLLFKTLNTSGTGRLNLQVLDYWCTKDEESEAGDNGDGSGSNGDCYSDDSSKQ